LEEKTFFSSFKETVINVIRVSSLLKNPTFYALYQVIKVSSLIKHVIKISRIW